jgi:hypothetical protein
MTVILRGMHFQEKLGGEGLETRAEHSQYQLQKYGQAEIHPSTMGHAEGTLFRNDI